MSDDEDYDLMSQDNQDEETKGQGWHKSQDPDGSRHAEAGRKGGEETKRRRGEAFYQLIGRKGGKARGRKQQNSETNSQSSVKTDYEDEELI